MTYLYPEHLRAKAVMWLWQLRDLTLIVIGVLLSVFVAVRTGSLIPAVMTAAFAFLTMRFDEVSILDFLCYASAFFFKQQYFEWRY